MIRFRMSAAASLVFGSLLLACAPQGAVGGAACTTGWQQVFETPLGNNSPPVVLDVPSVSDPGSAALSGNGRFLALGSTPSTRSITVRDLVTGVTETAPGATYLDSAPLISSDGSIVAFSRHTLPTNSFYPPQSTVVWNRSTGTLSTATASIYSRPVDMTPDGGKVLVQLTPADDALHASTGIYDTVTGIATTLDLSSVSFDSLTQAVAMSDDAADIALTVMSRSTFEQIHGVYHRTTNTFTPLATGFPVALDGGGHLASVLSPGPPMSGSIWNVSTGTSTPLVSEVALAMNRAGTVAIVTPLPLGNGSTGSAVSSLDLVTGEHRLISVNAAVTSPNFGVSGNAAFDKVVVVESSSPARAVVKQRC